MGNLAVIDGAIDKKLNGMHCAYIGKVISTDGATATVQPLGLMRDGAEAKARAVVTNVPVACRYKISAKTITCDGVSHKVAVPTQIANGDIVVCICADWDITEARQGRNALPPAGMHSISDSIIVGIL